MAPRTEMSPAEVLVVEDDPVLRCLLSFALHRAGYRACVAADGASGVRMARTIRPQLILTDICMPGMDGIEAARAIRADPVLCQIPIVAMTAWETPEVRARVRAAGLMGPVKKPLDLEGLPQQLVDWMTTPAGPPG